MRITPVSGWGPKTIDEILTDSPWTPEWGESMLQLVDRLGSLPDQRKIYASIDHWLLILYPEDSNEQTTWIWVAPVKGNEYNIEYLLPEATPIWPYAYVGGRAHSLDEAVKMILIAIEKSGGWDAP